MQQLQTIQTSTLNVDRRSVADLIFSGSNLQIEKHKPSLAVGGNYIAFSVAFMFMAGFTFMPILYAIVMFAIGMAVVFRIPGRWLAVLAFALPCSALLFYYNLFPRMPFGGLFDPYFGSPVIEFKRTFYFLTGWWGEGLLAISSLFAFYKILLGSKKLLFGGGKGE